MRVWLSKIWHPERSVLLDCQIGDGCTIHAPVWIGNKVVIGERCKVQAFAFLPEGVKIGNDVFIGPHVCFTNDKHPPSDQWSETIVEDGAVIGANSTILPGIRIGAKAMVGAGSVVTRDVPPGETVVGNPARVVPARAKLAA
jgi:UDP-2-acetamido-3-amino-2,3-dideoxy-glucuronate N-acetyltransferase